MKDDCGHSLMCSKCRPNIPAKASSFIFDDPYWNIFVGPVAFGGSIILVDLISFFKHSLV